MVKAFVEPQEFTPARRIVLLGLLIHSQKCWLGSVDLDTAAKSSTHTQANTRPTSPPEAKSNRSDGVNEQQNKPKKSNKAQNSL